MAVTLIPALPPGPGARDGQGRDRHPSNVPTVLVTNDDGIDAPGLAALARAAAGVGHVVVAAPVDDCSGSGAAVSPAWLADGILVSRVDLGGVGVDGPAYSVHGPPALAVLAGMSGALGAAAPRIVASGINRGSNTGIGVLHSGTVGAALTAGNLRVSALAISLACGAGGPGNLETAAAVAGTAMAWLLRAPAGTVLNVNVPDLPSAEVAGVREAPLARFGSVEAPLATLEPGQTGRMRLRLASHADASEVRSDATLLAAGYVTATCLAGVRVSGRTGVAEALRSGLRSVNRMRTEACR